MQRPSVCLILLFLLPVKLLAGGVPERIRHAAMQCIELATPYVKDDELQPNEAFSMAGNCPEVLESIENDPQFQKTHQTTDFRTLSLLQLKSLIRQTEEKNRIKKSHYSLLPFRARYYDASMKKSKPFVPEISESGSSDHRFDAFFSQWGGTLLSLFLITIFGCVLMLLLQVIRQKSAGRQSLLRTENSPPKTLPDADDDPVGFGDALNDWRNWTLAKLRTTGRILHPESLTHSEIEGQLIAKKETSLAKNVMALMRPWESVYYGLHPLSSDDLDSARVATMALAAQFTHKESTCAKESSD